MNKSNRNLLEAIKKQHIELVQKILNSGSYSTRNILLEKPNLFEKDNYWGRSFYFLIL